MSKSRVLSVGETIDNAPLSRAQRNVIALCIAIGLIDGLDVLSLGFTAKAVTTDLGITLPTYSAVFTASLLGMMVGGMALGPAADRFGRRKLIIISLLFIGLFALLTPLATTVEMLVVVRFLAGVGMGGVIPNVMALVAECVPARNRQRVLALIAATPSLGAFLGGFLATVLMPTFGWRSVFIVGGAVPLVLAVLAYYRMPESIKFLVVSGHPGEALRVLNLLVPGSDNDKTPIVEESNEPKSSVAALFAHGRAASTLVLWVSFSLAMMVIYFLNNWMPALFEEAGHTANVGVIALSLFSLGGVVGGVTIGYLADKLGKPATICAVGLFVGAGAIVTVSHVFASVPLLFSSVFVLGMGISGAIVGLSALAGTLYPTVARATGVGWVYGVSRVTSIVGPAIGGMLLAYGWDEIRLFTLNAIPTLVAGIGVVLLAWLTGRATQSAAPATAIRQTDPADA